MDSIDIDTLKRSCKANGLSDAGTKAELWGRLKGGSGGDKKKAKKPAAPAADAGPPASYVAKEYASLKIAGFDDEEEINELINKRWKKMQELKKASDSNGGGDKGKPKNVTDEGRLRFLCSSPRPRLPSRTFKSRTRNPTTRACTFTRASPAARKMQRKRCRPLGARLMGR